MKVTHFKSENGLTKIDYLKEVQSLLKESGFTSFINTKENGLSEIRLIPEIRGYNRSAFSNRRGRILSWYDWVEVNKALNKIADMNNLSCNIKTLGGKFVIREGKDAKTESDWDHLKYAYVNQYQGITMENAWYKDE